MRNKKRVVSKNTILERVWDYDFDPHTNVVEARVYKLREKIEREGEKRLITTIRGFGYVLGA
jgi:DNA-binding response OmpR family regulator